MKPKPAPIPRRRKTRPPSLDEWESLELVEDLGLRVRQARERLGLSQEDLGRRVGEKASLIRKIETGKMTPSLMLARRLEHVLRVKLIVPASEPVVPASPPPHRLTLGDIVQIKRRGREAEGGSRSA